MFIYKYYASPLLNSATGTKAKSNVCFPKICMIEYIPMSISVETIYEFHKVRTACHVASVNYFAVLIGYHFPEHDNDKNTEPMRTGYAYKNYSEYHPEYKIPDNYSELFDVAHKTHHEHATHHIEFYNGDVSKIPDVQVIEMVCDWFSANFEQVFVLRDYEYRTVIEWFDATMSDKNWSESQLKTIHETSEFLEKATNTDALMQIWSPVIPD